MDIKVLIEIPAGSSIKYEVDEKTGELTVDRFLHTAFVYPFNYGFVKDTKGGDNDPVDIIILSDRAVQAGVVIKCQPIGLLQTEDEEGTDTKIIGVPVLKVDPVFGEYKDIKDVPTAILNKIKHFFENYKTLEPGKWVKVKEFLGVKEAEQEITSAQK